MTGSPFLSDGTGIIKGTATIPDSIQGGLTIQFLISPSEFETIGILPEDLMDSPETCGFKIDFEITKVDPGTYYFKIKLDDPENDAETVFESTADEMVTVNNNEALTINPVFN
ncbi:MAG: hypothetical protein MUC95_00255 [Spirochaetes bacterium]|nr:hypothetical protein [Spirochaetota bacterium]